MGSTYSTISRVRHSAVKLVTFRVNVNQKFLTWVEQQNYYEVHEGAVESQNYVRKK